MPVFKYIDKDFFKTWGPEMAYVLGFLNADGNMSVSKRGAHFFSIQIADKEILYAMRSAMHSEHVISTRLSLKDRKTLYRLQIGSMEMCDDLRKHGLHERKTDHLLMPTVPRKYSADFVRGYFDGDGNIWKGTVHKDRKTQHETLQTAFTSCSKQFLEDLQSLLGESLSVQGSLVTLQKNRRKAAYRLQYSKRDSLQLFNFMYNGSTLRLERKYRLFKGYIAALR